VVMTADLVHVNMIAFYIYKYTFVHTYLFH
jgi:hypothetical protein